MKPNPEVKPAPAGRIVDLTLFNPTAGKVPAGPLTNQERRQYKDELEIIERTKENTRQFFGAVAAIKFGYLWREDFASWDDFCRTRLDMSGKMGNYLVSANRVNQALRLAGIPEKDLPRTESQARILSPYDANEQAAIWRAVIKDGEPTAAKTLDKAQQFRAAKQQQLLTAGPAAGPQPPAKPGAGKPAAPPVAHFVIRRDHGLPIPAGMNSRYTYRTAAGGWSDKLGQAQIFNSIGAAGKCSKNDPILGYAKATEDHAAEYRREQAEEEAKKERRRRQHRDKAKGQDKPTTPPPARTQAQAIRADLENLRAAVGALEETITPQPRPGDARILSRILRAIREAEAHLEATGRLPKTDKPAVRAITPTKKRTDRKSGRLALQN